MGGGCAGEGPQKPEFAGPHPLRAGPALPAPPCVFAHFVGLWWFAALKHLTKACW